MRILSNLQLVASLITYCVSRSKGYEVFNFHTQLHPNVSHTYIGENSRMLLLILILRTEMSVTIKNKQITHGFQCLKELF